MSAVITLWHLKDSHIPSVAAEENPRALIFLTSSLKCENRVRFSLLPDWRTYTFLPVDEDGRGRKIKVTLTPYESYDEVLKLDAAFVTSENLSVLQEHWFSHLKADELLLQEGKNQKQKNRKKKDRITKNTSLREAGEKNIDATLKEINTKVQKPHDQPEVLIAVSEPAFQPETEILEVLEVESQAICEPVCADHPEGAQREDNSVLGPGGENVDLATVFTTLTELVASFGTFKARFDAFEVTVKNQFDNVSASVDRLHAKQRLEYESLTFPVLTRWAEEVCKLRPVGTPHQRTFYVKLRREVCDDYVKRKRSILPSGEEAYCSDSRSLAVSSTEAMSYEPDVFLKVVDPEKGDEFLETPKARRKKKVQKRPSAKFNGCVVAEYCRSDDLARNFKEKAFKNTSSRDPKNAQVKLLAKLSQLERYILAINQYYQREDAVVGAALMSRSYKNTVQDYNDTFAESLLTHFMDTFPSIHSLHKKGRFVITHDLRL
ncbi:hypothetical protein HDU96_000392 [Phlyctochytrium bullatum]|nr:hypothetical protein HDU96_000392 [Phlyctochytrium bullatum]